MTWPCVMLTGPAVVENKPRRAPHQLERVSEDRDAGTMIRRPFPRYYHARYRVTLQTRDGFAGSGETATEQLLGMIDRLHGWCDRTPKIDGVNLILEVAASSENAKRSTPADLREATGTLWLQDVPNYPSATTTSVPTTKDLVVTADEDPGP
jgi:hypothetical protein